MKGYIISFVSALILMAVLYISVYAWSVNHFLGDSSFLGWQSIAVKKLVLAPLSFLSILLMLFMGVLWTVGKLSEKLSRRSSLVGMFLYLDAGALGAALFLSMVEPIIATDYFEYGIRQEFNRILEAIGYFYVNLGVYAFLILAALGTWYFTQFKTNSPN